MWEEKSVLSNGKKGNCTKKLKIWRRWKYDPEATFKEAIDKSDKTASGNFYQIRRELRRETERER